MRTPTEDRELVISGYTYDSDGKRAERIGVYTSDYSYMLKFDKLAETNPEEWHVEKTLKNGSDIVGKWYSCPISCISFRRGKMRLTDEQRKKRERQGREAMKRLKSSQNKGDLGDLET